MYKRSGSNLDHLKAAIDDTKNIMNEIGIIRNAEHYQNKKSFSTKRPQSPVLSHSNDGTTPRGSNKMFFFPDSLKSSSDENKPITEMSNNEINNRWLVEVLLIITIIIIIISIAFITVIFITIIIPVILSFLLLL